MAHSSLTLMLFFLCPESTFLTSSETWGRLLFTGKQLVQILCPDGVRCAVGRSGSGSPVARATLISTEARGATYT